MLLTIDGLNMLRYHSAIAEARVMRGADSTPRAGERAAAMLQVTMSHAARGRDAM